LHLKIFSNEFLAGKEGKFDYRDADSLNSEFLKKLKEMEEKLGFRKENIL